MLINSKRNVSPEFYTREEMGHAGLFMKSYKKKKKQFIQTPQEATLIFIYKITFP